MDQLRPEFEKAGIDIDNAELVPMVACVDTETRARIWNEGYEAAMAQHLADDPSLADDWLNEQKAKAWDEGYAAGSDDQPECTTPCGACMDCLYGGITLNPYRATP
jgi:hypothetical protein